MLTQHSNAFGNLLFACRAGVRKHDTACVGNLIVEKLTEVLHIHFALACIHNGGERIELCTLYVQVLHRSDNVGQLADARGLDQNSVGGVLLQHLRQRLAKVTDQRAADATGIHFVDLNTCFCKKTAVNTDLTEFVFDQHQLLARISLLDHFFDQRGLTRAQKTGKNINLGHSNLNPFS